MDLLTPHSSVLKLAHNPKTKQSKDEREMLRKKNLNHKMVELNSFSLKLYL